MEQGTWHEFRWVLHQGEETAAETDITQYEYYNALSFLPSSFSPSLLPSSHFLIPSLSLPSLPLLLLPPPPPPPL